MTFDLDAGEVQRIVELLEQDEKRRRGTAHQRGWAQMMHDRKHGEHAWRDMQVRNADQCRDLRLKIRKQEEGQS
jgi:hypothetical protein